MLTTAAYILSTVSLLFPGYTLKKDHVRQVECIAAAVYSEARGEPAIGQVAVAHVVVNRVRSGLYPKDACGVVFQPHQFTGLKRDMRVNDPKAWKQSVKVAISAYTYVIHDPTGGALWYYNPKKAKPKWRNSFKFAAYIGNHRFLKPKG